MIVWRNSTKEITDADFERIARTLAIDSGLVYHHYDKFLEERYVTLQVTCEGGKQLRTEVLCDYIFGRATQ
jgi:hypothetical protein